MILAAALTAIAAVLVLGWLRLMGFWPYRQDAGQHAAPRHHGRPDVWDDDEPQTVYARAHRYLPQAEIDERDGYLETGQGLPDDDEPWAPLLRGHLAAGDAPTLTKGELDRIAERLREAQARPVRLLPETPAYLPAPVQRAPRVTAGRHAADRSAGQEGPRMLRVNGRDERDFPHLARTWQHETGSWAAIGTEASRG